MSNFDDYELSDIEQETGIEFQRESESDSIVAPLFDSRGRLAEHDGAGSHIGDVMIFGDAE